MKKNAKIILLGYVPKGNMKFKHFIFNFFTAAKDQIRLVLQNKPYAKENRDIAKGMADSRIGKNYW